MDVFESVREIAPSGDVTSGDVTRARRALEQEILRSEATSTATRPRAPRRHYSSRAIAVVCAVLLVAGVGAGVVAAGILLPRTSAPISTEVTPPTDTSTYLCRGNEIPASALNNPRPAAELEPDVRDIIATVDSPGSAHADAWTIVTESPRDVIVIRPVVLADDPSSSYPQVDHQLIEATRLTPDGPWSIGQNTTCALLLDLPPLTVMVVQLDPDHPLQPGSKVVHLLLSTEDCGTPTDIRAARQRETATTVDLIIAGVPPEGPQVCPLLPPRPFAITLEQPIGARVLIDAGLYDRPQIRPAPAWPATP